MSDPIPAQGSEWKPLAPEALDRLHQGGNQSASSEEDSGSSFQLLYEASKHSDSPCGFIPLYADTDSPESAGKDETPASPEEIRRNAYEEGFSEGRNAGFTAGKAEADAIVERMQSLLAEIERIWQHLTETYEKQIVQLVCRVSEKVVMGQAAGDHEMVQRSIIDAFRMIPEPVEVTLEINPEDVEFIETAKEDFFKQVKELKHMALIPDPSVSPGGCRLKTRFGEVDATIESRLDSIQRTIMDVYRDRLKDAGSV